MHYFDIFKCHMNTSRNHHKAYLVDVANRTMFLDHKTVKQAFQNGMNLKDMADIWWPPICLSKFLQGTFHWFSMGIQMTRIFCFKSFSTVMFASCYQFGTLVHQKGLLGRFVEFSLNSWSYGTWMFTLVWMGKKEKKKEKKRRLSK